MNASGIEPLDVKVIVRPDGAETKIGSIIIPDATADRQKFAVMKATLIESGPNAFKEWGAGSAPETGSRILTAQYAGARIKGHDGQDYVIMNDEDVLATIKEET